MDTFTYLLLFVTTQPETSCIVHKGMSDRGMAQPCLLWGIRGPQLVASQLCWVRQTEKETGGILNEPFLVLAEGDLGTASIYASVQWVR